MRFRGCCVVVIVFNKKELGVFALFERKSYGVFVLGLFALGLSQLSFAAKALGPSISLALSQPANDVADAQTGDSLTSSVADKATAHSELEVLVPLGFGHKGEDRRGVIVIDRRMFKHLRTAKNADVLPSKEAKALQEVKEGRSTLAENTFAEALETAKQEEEARADRALREQAYLQWQQRQQYAPQISGVPLPQQGRLFP
ncbi:hypothetical protein R6242_17935 [Iodobacter sp. CM08]|uniref:hypothetical protein n=1 Tax=Iodobacter sp. CM08 TaxID=3085902 RepID=UPI002981885C|nr:hypothetical protein [Iodobacter sp. CM08]MDW5418447.1 hypothetical protein [Iodobacter sp. CM08]